jgi:hypothetical protein
MKEKIDALTHEQAQRALLRFYELLPEELWQGTKPTFGDLEYWREEIEDSATPDIEPFLKALEDEIDPSTRGATARILLMQFAAYEPLQPYVEEAVEEATVPHMTPLPEIIVAATIILAAIPRKITWTDKTGKFRSIEIGQLDNAAEWIKSITGFLKEAKGLI